jgi:hypothetical protein
VPVAGTEDARLVVGDAVDRDAELHATARSAASPTIAMFRRRAIRIEVCSVMLLHLAPN